MERIPRRSKLDFVYKWLNTISYIDLQITRNLKDAGYKTRPVNSNGLWCPILLPFILLLYTWTCKVSATYKIIAFVSLGLLSYSLLFIAFLTISCVVIKESIYGGCTASGFIAVLVIYLFGDQEIYFSLLVAMSSTFLYSHLLRYAIKEFPGTFTIGEAMVVIQGAVLFGAALIIMLVEVPNYDTETNFMNILIFVEYIILAWIIALFYFLNANQKLSGTLVTVGTFSTIAALVLYIGPSSIPRLIYHLFNRIIHRVRLISLWLILLTIAGIALVIHTKRNRKADTVTRKLFHILASLVFLFGIVTDISLMNLAAGIGLGLLLFIEAIRKSEIQPLSSMLQSAFLVYSDEKDSGTFAMTPIYLYVGMACPLLLVPHSNILTLELLSGVLSIGIGDSAASWLGSKFGRIKWPGTNRTLEGTAGNIVSQVAMVYIIETLGYLHTKRCLVRSIIASTITSLVEAETDQVDNIILPLVTIISYRLTWFIL